MIGVPRRLHGRHGVVLGQGLRFVAVGIVNNVVVFTTYLLLGVGGLAPIPAMSAAYVTGMVISFVANRRWTFGHSGSGAGALVRFLVVNAIGYGVNFTILAIFVERLGWSHVWVQLVALGVVAMTTFTLLRLWVFRR